MLVLLAALGLCSTLACSSIPVKAPASTLVEPTPGHWKADQDDSWVTTCTYTPQYTPDEYITCLLTINHETSSSK